MVKDNEVRLTLIIGLEDSGSLHSLDAVFRKIRGHLVEQQGVNTLILIVWADSNQKQVEVGHLLRPQRLQQVIPAKWE